jgi:hypothetical protein
MRCWIIRRPLQVVWSLMGKSVGEDSGHVADYCLLHRAICERGQPCPRKPDFTPDMREYLAAMRELQK